MASSLSLLLPSSDPSRSLRPSLPCLLSDCAPTTSSGPLLRPARGFSLRRARPVHRPRSFKVHAVQVETSSDLYEETQERLATLVKESPTLRLKAAKKLQELAEELAKEEVDEATVAAIALHPVEKIKKGFTLFKNAKFLKQPKLFDQLKTGQSPKLMIIACSDSRVCPTNVLGLEPGEAFIVRNVANLVPAWEEEKGFPGTSAALEYAVLHLKVEHILVMGHSMCGGIRALMSQPEKESPKWSYFIEDWIQIGRPARNQVKSTCGSASLDEQCRHCEKESVNFSLSNLSSFPFIKDLVAEGKLTLHGGYYDFIDGSFHHWTSESETNVLC